VTSGVSSFNSRTGAVTLATSDISGAGGALVASTVASFNARTGSVTLQANDISAVGGAMLASPAFTGTPTAPTPPVNDNSGRIATTAFINSYTGFAPVNSPAFTGVPSAPTAALNTSTTQLATTAFVMNAISDSVSGVASFNGRTGAVTLISNDISSAGGALLSGPVFTGAPQAPTAAPGTSTTQLATTAFVMAALAAAASNATPVMNGVAAPGTSALFSRADHVHPTDTSRAAQASLANYLPLAGGTMAVGAQIFTPNSGLVSKISGTANALIGVQFQSAAGTSLGYLSYTITGNAQPFWISLVNASSSPQGSIAIASNGQTICSNTLQAPQVTMNATTNPLLTFNGGRLWMNSANNAVTLDNQAAGGASITLDASNSMTFNGPTANKIGGGSWTASSDARIKTVLGDYDKGLEDVLALRPVGFVYKGNDTPTADLSKADPDPALAQRATGSAPYPGSPHYREATDETRFVGLLAQEVEAIFPSMVKAAPGFIDGRAVDDLRTLDVSELIFALVNAVKTLAARVSALEAT
jgi:hypothetical protein